MQGREKDTALAIHHKTTIVTFDDDFQKIAAVSNLQVDFLKGYQADSHVTLCYFNDRPRCSGDFVLKAMKMSEGGRVVVPAEIRKALNVHDGDVVYWELVEGEARLTTKLARLRRSQQMVQSICPNPEGASVVDDLLVDRRREASPE